VRAHAQSRKVVKKERKECDFFFLEIWGKIFGSSRAPSLLLHCGSSREILLSLQITISLTRKRRKPFSFTHIIFLTGGKKKKRKSRKEKRARARLAPPQKTRFSGFG
jgi:hypothetical protein